MMLPAGARLAARGQAPASAQVVASGCIARPHLVPVTAPVRCPLGVAVTRKVLARPVQSALQALETANLQLTTGPALPQLPGTVVVNFHVSASETATGVRIVGNIPVLGDWNPDQGVALEHVAQNMWSAACTLPDDWEGCIEYKVVETPENAPAVWEGGPNRKLQVAGVSDITCVTVLDVSCEWGKEGVAVKLSRPAPTVVDPPRNGNGHSKEGSPGPRSRHPVAGDPVPCRLLMTLPEPVGPGVEYVLVGSAQQMGAWELENGVKLAAGSSPHIVEADAKLPCGTDIEFKVVTLYPNSAPVWEKGPNRTLHMPMPPDDHGPGRMALLLHLLQPAMVHHVYEQACQGELGNLPENLPTECLISVPSFHVRPGQELLLAGSLPELGDWMVEGALLLRSVGPDCWQGEVTLPLGAQAEAKLVVRDPSGACYWETGANRVLRVSGDCTAISGHATSATSCITLMPNPAVAPAVVFPVFGGPDGEELPPPPPRARTRSPSPPVDPEQGVFNVVQAAVSGQPTVYPELPNGYGQQGSLLAENNNNNSRSSPGMTSSSNSRRSQSPGNAGGRFGQSTSDRSGSANAAGTSGSNSLRQRGGKPSGKGGSPPPPSAPLQQMRELEGRMNRLRTDLGAAEGHWDGPEPDTDSEPDHAWQRPPTKGGRVSKSPEPAARRSVGRGSTSPGPKASKQEDAAATAMEQATGKNGRSARKSPATAAPVQPPQPEPDFFASSAVPSTFLGFDEPAAAPAPEPKPVGRVARGRASRGSSVKSPAPLGAAPDGMEVYEARVLGILAACPNQSLDQVQAMLSASNFPPRYNKSMDQLRGLMTYLVAHGSVSSDPDGRYRLRDIEVVPATRRRSASPRTAKPRSSPSPAPESAPAAQSPQAAAEPTPARRRAARRSSTASVDDGAPGEAAPARRKRAPKKDSADLQTAGARVTSKAKSAAERDADSQVLPVEDGEAVAAKKRVTRRRSPASSPTA